MAAVRNPQHNLSGTYDCEIEHPQYGWIPFTASPSDTEEFGRSLHADIAAGKHGVIAAYRQPSDGELAREALLNRDRLLARASEAMAPLQDAIDLGMATAAEVERLIAWKRYRVDLNRIEQQPGYPASILWPVAPS